MLFGLRMPAPPVGLPFAARAALCCVVGVLPAPLLYAQEDIDDEAPTPASVREMVSPMGRLLGEKPAATGVSGALKERLKDAPVFFRDTRLTVSPRSYYLRRRYYDETISEAWAVGGAIDYRSGLAYDRVAIGLVLNTSQALYAPDGRSGSDLLAPGQQGYSVASQAYLRVRFADRSFVNLYRYGEFNSPYLSRNDGRMTPYSFEGYTVQGLVGGADDAPRFSYGGGYVGRIKDKTAEKFVSMSEKAGTGSDVKRGVSTLGGLYSHGGFSLGAIDYYSRDIINIAYAEAGYTTRIGDDVGARVAAQFTDQRSVGDGLLRKYSFATRQGGIRGDFSRSGAVASLAYTANAGGQDLQNPWSGYPGYTSSMITDYKKAGTHALTGKLSYVFSQFGLDGVAAYALVAHGWGMVDQASGAPLANENEYDLDLQFRPRWHYLSGLAVRMRHGVACQYQGPKHCSRSERLVFNYELPLL